MKPRYAIIRQEPQACHACGEQTIFACMSCAKHVCPLCSFSMTAQCQDCRAKHTGTVWELGKKADAYVRAEFDRLFAPVSHSIN